MAWEGDVFRKVRTAAADTDDGSSILELECGHHLRCGMRPAQAISHFHLTGALCPLCSEANWDKIREARRSIGFSAVLDRIRGLTP